MTEGGAERPREVESVWDYPRPPRWEHDGRRVTVRYGTVTVADSSRCLRVLETSHAPVFYIPVPDVRTDLLSRSARTSFCEWKGIATFWDLLTTVGALDAVAWSYERPTPPFTELRGHIAFYARADVRCEVAGERVRAQPGHFYGGWITDDVTGPFKGGPRTSGW